MIAFKQSGDFKYTEKFLKQAVKANFLQVLQKYAKEGVSALASATPINTGKTSRSWDYEIQSSNGNIKIYWTNSNIVDNVPIAVILEYGHGTRNGGYVQGRDYIKPAIRPVFDRIADGAWKEVSDI
jgi:hypothetical protein